MIDIALAGLTGLISGSVAAGVFQRFAPKPTGIAALRMEVQALREEQNDMATSFKGWREKRHMEDVREKRTEARAEDAEAEQSARAALKDAMALLAAGKTPQEIAAALLPKYGGLISDMAAEKLGL